MTTIRTNAFSSMASGDVTDLIKTKMCLYYKAGCTNKSCTFAHSKDELNHPMCRFGITCRKNNCYFYHPGQVLPSKDDLFFRATNGIKFVEPTPVSTTPNKLTDDTPEFIIKVGEESDEEESNEREEESEETVESVVSNTETITPSVEGEVPVEGVATTTDTTEVSTEGESHDVPDQDIEMEQVEWDHQQPPQMFFNPHPQMFFNPQQPPQPKRRVQFEAILTQDEMMGLMRLLKNNGNNPILLSMG